MISSPPRRLKANEIIISLRDNRLPHQNHFQSKSGEKAGDYNYPILGETWLIRLRRALSGLLKFISKSSLMSQGSTEGAHLPDCCECGNGWVENGLRERRLNTGALYSIFTPLTLIR